MVRLHVLTVFALLVVATTAAGAQPWGGGGPGVSQPRVRAHVAPRVRVVYVYPLVVAPIRVTYDANDHRRSGSGGTWDGGQPTWGGSPPVNPLRSARQDANAFFGYVPPRPALTPRRPDPTPLQRTTREAYLERFGAKP